MDDGFRFNNTYALSTAGFTLEENLFLSQLLFTRFNLLVNLQGLNSRSGTRNKHIRLYIKQESSLNFKGLIEPHLVPSMRYKLVS